MCGKVVVHPVLLPWTRVPCGVAHAETEHGLEVGHQLHAAHWFKALSLTASCVLEMVVVMAPTITAYLVDEGPLAHSRRPIDDNGFWLCLHVTWRWVFLSEVAPHGERDRHEVTKKGRGRRGCCEVDLEEYNTR